MARFLDRARQILAGQELANMVLLRGFERLPDLPSMHERYGVRGLRPGRISHVYYVAT